MTAECSAPLDMMQLAAYWLDEASAEEAEDFEEHLLSCATCTRRLAEFVHLTAGVRAVARESGVSAVLTPAYVEHLKSAGAQVREYRVEPQGSVNCTVAPDDDLVVAHLRAPLTGVRRVDLLFDHMGTGSTDRAKDVPFDAATNEVVVQPATPMLRQLGVASQRMQLIAVEESGERVLGTYTFNHSPWRPG